MAVANIGGGGAMNPTGGQRGEGQRRLQWQWLVANLGARRWDKAVMATVAGGVWI